ncbi:MAG TPA: hypothetical protein VD947_04245 [Patescibacteria group bacterium]|nr:hypothetical protein [Patescibacteria group bacterium]
MNPTNNNNIPEPDSSSRPPSTVISPQNAPPAPSASSTVQPQVPLPIQPLNSQSHSDLVYNQSPSKNKRKVIISIVSIAVFIALIGGGMFAVLSMDDKEKESEALKSEQVSSQEVAEQKSDESKTIPRAVTKSIYPAELRAIYIDACNPGDKSNCECEVNYFEKNLPVEQFRQAMEESKESAEYNKVFGDAYLACED